MSEADDIRNLPAIVVTAEDPSALELVMGHGVRTLALGLSSTRARMRHREQPRAEDQHEDRREQERVRIGCSPALVTW